MIQKQAVAINFAQGLDTKTDPFQVPLGKFLSLVNMRFDKVGLLHKRNGFDSLPTLPAQIAPPGVTLPALQVQATTFNGSLTAIGASIEALSQGSQAWINKGNFYPISFSTLPGIRSAINQTQCDAVTAPNGITCIVFTEVNAGTPAYKYAVQDSTTGQYIVNPTAIPVASGAVSGSPRVFLMGGYFVVVFTNTITGTPHLQYIAISVSNPNVVSANADIASNYVPTNTVNWDGLVVGSNLYIAFDTTAGGQQVKVVYLNSSFIVSTAQSFAGSIATMFSMCADITNPASPIIYISFYDAGGSTGYVAAVDQNLNVVMTPTQIITALTVLNLASTAQSNIVVIAYEVSNAYIYDGAIPTNFLNHVTVIKPATVTTGTVGPTVTFIRSVGLASKAFLINGTMYMLGAYQSALQKTYFLFDIGGRIISRIAYENGGGYLGFGLPQAQVIGDSVKIAYLYKDLIQTTAVSLGSQGAPATTNIYSQTGVNVGTFQFNSSTLSVSELGNNLNISGGMLWSYDGQTISEQGFNLFPDNVEATWSATGGAIHAQPDGATNTNAYYYQVTYEWTDSQGNIFRSTPSIPVGVTTTGSGTAGSITVHIPTLRLTYKPDVKIVIYRWSVANPIYYQVTSITSPLLNSGSIDQVTYVDTLADASIVGNSIIYTTGGVIEDIGGPASTATTLFDNRLWLIDAEDQNLLWYSKQVIEATPVEMSDLLTIYVSPTTGSQGSTGVMRCIFPMDDKLIIWKKDALYYINGSGPDNTGANSQYSQPIFITSSVGSTNQNSIVMIPDGLMFQSDKGIWILTRNLQTSYIGAPVEQYNQYVVNSAVSIPGKNEVRFTMSNGITLVYDYFVNQWETDTGVPAISSTLYEGLHTYVSPTGGVSQESPGKYLDNGNPVLISFITSWINLAGLQGYQRAFWFFLLGKYLTPHKLSLNIAYDYNPSPIQSTLISPDNFSPAYGQPSPYGQQDPYGGPTDIERWRIFLKKQRCESFQISLEEIYDPSFGVPAGQGLTLSGLNLIVGIQRGWRTESAAHSAGSSS